MATFQPRSVRYGKEGKLKAVMRCLDLGMHLNTITTSSCFTALTLAAQNGNMNLLNTLLSHPDIDINTAVRTENMCDWTALMFACHAGNSAIVSRLVEEEELDINYQDQKGETAALLASYYGHTECVRVLAETGKVDWNARNKWGNTALYCALYWGHSYVVDIIIEIPGLNFNVRTVAGETLGQAAVTEGFVRSVESLASLEKFDCWNVPDKNGDTPVMMALKWGATDIVKVLVRCPRVDLTIRDKEGWTLLMRTIAGKELELTKMILAQLEKKYTESTLARIAVEVLDEEEIKLVVQSWYI